MLRSTSSASHLGCQRPANSCAAMIFELMRLLSFIAVLVLLPFAAPHATAQAYPTKPVRMIVPWAPGGSTDTLGRVIAQKSGELCGQPIQVENRRGSDGLNCGGDGERYP